MHRYMSASEAAAVLGVTRETARHLAASGQIEATRTSAGWMLDADAVAKEARMRRQYGRISPEQAAKMAPNLSEADRATLRLLTGDPVPVRASAPSYGGDGEEEFEAEFASLYPPRTPAEAEHRRELAEHIRASNAAAAEDEDEDEAYERLLAAHWPPETRP